MVIGIECNIDGVDLYGNVTVDEDGNIKSAQFKSPDNIFEILHPLVKKTLVVRAIAEWDKLRN